MKTNGLPGYSVDILDKSTLAPDSINGLYALALVTEFGEAGKPKFVSGLDSYTANFGKLVVGDKASLFARILLDAKIPFYVVPIHGYSDVTDPTTLLGTKASLSLNASAVSETLATSTLTITATGVAADKVNVYANTPDGMIFLGTGIVPSTPTVTTVAVAVKNAINALTAAHGFTATNLVGVVTVTAPIGTGAVANNPSYSLVRTIEGATTTTIVQFSGGVTAQEVCAFVCEAKAVGAAFNEATLEVIDAYSGKADLFDIIVKFRGVTTTITDVPESPNADELALVNVKLGMIGFSSITTLGVTAETALTSGAAYQSLIGPQHYSGNATALTGIWAAKTLVGIVGIHVPAIADPFVDKALEAFVNAKPGVGALLNTSLGLSGSAALDYREMTGQVPAAVNTWRASMTTGGFKIKHPVSGAFIDMPETLQIVYSVFRGFNAVGPWAAPADPEFAKWAVPQALLKDFALEDSIMGDLLTNRGLNTFTKDDVDGIVPNGNCTLYKTSSLLQKWNVANYFLMLERELPGIMKSARKQFKPNTPAAWFAIYNAVQPYIQKHKDKEAIYDFAYEGDQFVTNVSQAVINTPDIRNASNYQFYLYIYPTPSLERIGALVTVTSSSEQITLLTGN